MLPNDLLQEEQEKARPHEWRGADSMLSKILFQTIEDFLRGDYWAKEDIAGNKGNGIFSFGTLCRYFNLHEEAVKRQIEKLTLKKWRKIKRAFGFRVVNARAKKLKL